MDFYKEFESIIRQIFQEQDLVIALMLKEALEKGRGKDQDIYSSLAWASGNLKSRFPEVSNVLFKFIEIFKYDKN